MRMKLCLLVLVSVVLTSSVSSAQDLTSTIPNPQEVDGSWVYDGAGLLGDKKVLLNQLISRVEQQTSAEIAVVILPSIGDNVPKPFATDLFAAWGVGKKEKDNGVLVLHVLDQRRVEIETGYGVEAKLTDSHCRWIIAEIMKPFFKAESYGDGHLEMVRALARGLRGPPVSRSELIGVEDWLFQPGERVDTRVVVPEWSPTTLYRLRSYRQRLLSFWTFGLGLLLLLASIVGPLVQQRSVAQPDKRLAFQRKLSPLGRVGIGFITLDTAFFFIVEFPTEPFAMIPLFFGMVGWFLFEIYLGRRVSNLDKGPRACPACKAVALREVETKVLVSTSYDSSGVRQHTRRCSKCGHETTHKETIPQLSRTTGSSSSSSGSSSGGSSSGGSFGGGSSGGGGAGGNY